VATYLLRRLGLAFVTLWILSMIVFFAGQVLPGDPGRSIPGNLAAPSAVRALDHQIGVDRPLLTRYWSWVSGLVHDNMGLSYQFRSAVEPFIHAAIVNSALGSRLHATGRGCHADGGRRHRTCTRDRASGQRAGLRGLSRSVAPSYHTDRAPLRSIRCLVDNQTL
jgi:hypothetical protein